MFSLEGRVAIVTGAASGLGRDAALAYAEAGADVAVLDIRPGHVESLAKEIEEKYGKKALPIGCDISKEEQVKNAVDNIINKFGKIDILLNCAGIARFGSVETVPLEDWNEVMAVNLGGPYLMSKYVVPHMRKANYGKIIFISSVNALVTEPLEMFSRQSYNASKAGVVGLTKAMAGMYGPYGITVNTIAPGLFRTEMTEGCFTTEEGKPLADFIIGNLPMKRHGKPGELNGTVIYLSSDASSYVTGQYICVDGGCLCF